MVLEHQSAMHNRIIRATLETRLALYYQEDMNKSFNEKPDTVFDSTKRRIQNVSEELVKYLLFSGEAIFNLCHDGQRTKLIKCYQWFDHAVFLGFHHPKGFLNMIEGKLMRCQCKGIDSFRFVSIIRIRRPIRSEPPGHKPVRMVLSLMPTPQANLGINTFSPSP